MIELRNIKKHYYIKKDEFLVLKDLNLQINEGDFIAIMGPSGSGKSTLMNILGLLDNPSSGGYFINSQDISSYSDDEKSQLRNEMIGFVFQQFNLLPRLNVKKNILLPLIYAKCPKEIRGSKVEKALTEVGLIEKINVMPNELSGGQKQRVAIARAIINNPRLLLADEPTGALDSKTSIEIMNLMKELNLRGTTIVLITHDYEVAKYASRIINIDDGKFPNE